MLRPLVLYANHLACPIVPAFKENGGFFLKINLYFLTSNCCQKFLYHLKVIDALRLMKKNISPVIFSVKLWIQNIQLGQ